MQKVYVTTDNNSAIGTTTDNPLITNLLNITVTDYLWQCWTTMQMSKQRDGSLNDTFDLLIDGSDMRYNVKGCTIIEADYQQLDVTSDADLVNLTITFNEASICN